MTGPGLIDTIAPVKVLLATDGSDRARATADLLYRLLPPQAEVVLLSVSGDSELPTDEVAPGALSQLRDALQGETERLLAAEVERLEEAGHEVQVMIRHGDAGDQVTRAAEEVKADLLAVGSRGLSPFKEFLLGSVSQRVIRHSPCSVLLGRPDQQEEPGGREGREALRIVLAIDGSDPSRAAARSLARLARHHRFEVHCVTVLPAPRDWGVDLARHASDATRRDRERAAQLLRQTCAMLQTAGAPASSHLLVGSDPAEELIEYARGHGCRLLAIGNKGLSAVDRFLLGSVSHKIVHYATCPVLLVKGTGLVRAV